MNGRSYFRWLVIATGLVLFTSTLYQFPHERADLRLSLLAAITLIGASRLAVAIPGIEGRITVSDTMVFLILLLYGGEAAVLVAAFEGASSSLRISRKASTLLFNASVMTISTLTGVTVLRACFGRAIETPPHLSTGRLIVALAILALVHYFVNSGLVAIDRALKTGEPMISIWRHHYLWTLLTYFAGAAAAGMVARLSADVGFFPVFLTMQSCAASLPIPLH